MAKRSTMTVKQYLDALTPERRSAIGKVRKVIRENLPKGYEETINWGMLSYEIPLTRYPETYNGQPLGYAALASQKNYLVLYLYTVYGDKKTEQWFTSRYKASGKKLDMGKSCVRFRSAEDLPLDLIGEVIARTPVDKYVEVYERSRRK